MEGGPRRGSASAAAALINRHHLIMPACVWARTGGRGGRLCRACERVQGRGPRSQRADTRTQRPAHAHHGAGALAGPPFCSLSRSNSDSAQCPAPGQFALASALPHHGLDALLAAFQGTPAPPLPVALRRCLHSDVPVAAALMADEAPPPIPARRDGAAPAAAAKVRLGFSACALCALVGLVC